RRRVSRSRRSASCSTISTRAGTSESCEPRLDALVSLLLRPQVEGYGEQVVDFGDGPRVDREIDRLDVPLARLARLDAGLGAGLGMEEGQLLGVVFAAARAANAHEGPLAAAERAAQIPQRSVRALLHAARR